MAIQIDTDAKKLQSIVVGNSIEEHSAIGAKVYEFKTVGTGNVLVMNKLLDKYQVNYDSRPYETENDGDKQFGFHTKVRVNNGEKSDFMDMVYAYSEIERNQNKIKEITRRNTPRIRIEDAKKIYIPGGDGR